MRAIHSFHIAVKKKGGQSTIYQIQTATTPKEFASLKQKLKSHISHWQTRAKHFKLKDILDFIGQELRPVQQSEFKEPTVIDLHTIDACVSE